MRSSAWLTLAGSSFFLLNTTLWSFPIIYFTHHPFFLGLFPAFLGAWSTCVIELGMDKYNLKSCIPVFIEMIANLSEFTKFWVKFGIGYFFHCALEISYHTNPNPSPNSLLTTTDPPPFPFNFHLSIIAITTSVVVIISLIKLAMLQHDRTGVIEEVLGGMLKYFLDLLIVGVLKYWMGLFSFTQIAFPHMALALVPIIVGIIAMREPIDDDFDNSSLGDGLIGKPKIEHVE